MARCTFNKECHFNTPRLEKGRTVWPAIVSPQSTICFQGVFCEIFVTMMMDEKAKIPHSTGNTLRRTTIAMVVSFFFKGTKGVFF
jgi:hypothetical protein